MRFGGSKGRWDVWRQKVKVPAGTENGWQVTRVEADIFICAQEVKATGMK